MRNFKRVLSLALALVMVIGMMVMGAGAAGLTDYDEIEYKEAVSVAQALKIIDGLPNGAFNPKGELTREGAAILVCRLVCGRENADKLIGVNGFADVAADWYSAGYIEFCANNGYIGGFPDGNFYPTLPMVTYGFGKLLLCALGYDAEIEGYGDAKAIKADMAAAGITEKGINLDATLTREVAAQLLWNAMNAKRVETVPGTTILIGGVPVTTGATVKDSEKKSFADEAGLTKLTENLDPDAFGRPASYLWYIDADEIPGFDADEDILVYEAMKKVAYTYTVTGSNDTTLAGIAKKLDKKVATSATLNATPVKGDTVELYVDAKGAIELGVVLHTELAQISKVTKTTDKDAKYTYVVTLKGGATYKDTQLIGFDAETMVKDTYITMVKGTGVAIVAEAEYVTGKQTATGTGYIKVDGEKMSYVPGAVDGVNYSDTYKFFVANGLIIGNAKVKAAQAQVDSDVFYITDTKFSVGGTWDPTVAKLSVEYLDGSKEVLDMAITTKTATPGVKYVNKDTKLSEASFADGFYTYTLNDAGEVATLKAVGTDHTADKATHVYLADTKKVSFLKGKANVEWNGVTFFADEDTTVNFVNVTGNETVTGYAAFKAKDFTASSSVRALMEFDGDEVVAIYIFGAAFEATPNPGVLGVYISTGDTTYKAATQKYYTEVVYNVKGENVTYTIEGSSVASNVKGFATIVVTDGIAALTPAEVKSENVEKVTATYLVIDNAPVPFASSVAYYDVTNVAKNGVVADDEVVVGDIIHYVLNKDNEITAVYTTYAAQEDGQLAIDLSDVAAQAYYTDVLGCNIAELNNFDETKSGEYVLYQYTRPADYESLSIVVELLNEVTGEYELNWSTSAAWNPAKVGTCGFLFYKDSVSVAGEYIFEIKVDNDVIMSGSFELE